MRISLALLTLCLLAPCAEAQFIYAPGIGTTGDQHIEFPAYDSRTNGAPYMRVAGVGDVNGDGLEDIGTGFSGGERGDDVHITFSSRHASAGPVDQHDGFRIRTDGFVGMAGVGDVNRDGLADVALALEDSAVVVFGKRDRLDVLTAALGLGGFEITGVGPNVFHDRGIASLGDVNGDAIPDLAIVDAQLFYIPGQSYGEPAEVAVVHPPANVAGMTIDASAPGPHVSRITFGDTLICPRLDALGDVDGDGRGDLLVGDEERGTTDQVAYGIRTPAPGTTVDAREAVTAGDAFELRTHDGLTGFWGELEDVRTLGDQNGDGRRDVGMLGVPNSDKRRRLRAVYTPPFGTRRDVDDLWSDARGYAQYLYANVADTGDQDGDGRDDFATSSFVLFADPARDGAVEPALGRGFSFQGEPHGVITGSIDDLNGDGRPEVTVTRVTRADNYEDGVWKGERATYALEIFDSARAPVVSLPELPVPAAGGELEFPVTIDAGAGSRGGTSLAAQAWLEVQTAAGASIGEVEGKATTASAGPERVALRMPASRFEPGRDYRYRYRAVNSRGQSAAGPWRTLTVPAVAPVTHTRLGSLGKLHRGTSSADRILGTRHADRLYGLGGNDRLVGRDGPDRLFGGNGRDRIDARDGIRDHVDCGRGRDLVRADAVDELRRCERRRF